MESKVVGRILGRHAPGDATVITHQDWTMHDALVNGARNDMRSAMSAYAAAQARYAGAEQELERTTAELRAATERLAALEASDA